MNFLLVIELVASRPFLCGINVQLHGIEFAFDRVVAVLSLVVSAFTRLEGITPLLTGGAFGNIKLGLAIIIPLGDHYVPLYKL